MAARSTALVLSLCLVAPEALAQRVVFVSRSGNTDRPGAVNRRDCPSDTWTFRVESGDSARTDVPALWLASGSTCLFSAGDSACVRVGVTPTRDATCASGVCWSFAVPGGTIVDPAGGSCTRTGSGSVAVLARFTDATAVFQEGRIAWDTEVPSPPLSVSAAYANESQVQVSWTYASATAADAGTDADVADADDADVADADVSDVTDASDDADVADVTDASTTTDAASTSMGETLRRFWVLCDPADGTDAGCASGGFTGLDIDDTRTLEMFAGRCGLGDAGVSSSQRAVTLTGLAAGRPYRFAVVAEDLAGNRSAATRAATCSAAETYTDFWESYRAGGGAARPECSASPGRIPRARTLLLGAGLVLVVVVARRRVSAAGGRGRRS